MTTTSISRSTAPTRSQTAGAKRDRQWLWIHLTSLAVLFAVLVLLGRGQWFFGDDWDYVVFRGFAHPARSLFLPHNEHWDTAIVVYYRAIFNVVGLRTYTPYLAGALATHLLLTHGLWRLMLRAEADVALATGLALAFGMYGAGGESLLWAAVISYLAPIAIGVWLLLLISGSEPRASRVVLVALANAVAVMCGSFGLIMVAVVALLAFHRWGARLAAMVTAPAAGIYVAWLIWHPPEGVDSPSLHGSLGDIPRFVWGGLSSAIGVPVHSIRLGEFLVAVLIAAAAVQARKLVQRATAVVALALGQPVAFALIAHGRGAAESPAAPRYVYVAAALILPLVGCVVTPLVRGSAPRVSLALAICVALAGSGFVLLRDEARFERGRELETRGQVLAAMDLVDREPIVSDTPEFRYAGSMSFEQLDLLRRKDQLPRAVATARDDANARLAMQLNVVRRTDQSLGGGITTTHAGAFFAPAPNGCLEVDLHGTNLDVVRQIAVARFSVTPTNGGTIRAFVPFERRYTDPRVFLVDAGKPIVVEHAVDRAVAFQLPPGLNRVCGLSLQ